MSKPLSVTLSIEERNYLTSLTRSGNAPARVQTRARILLLADRSAPPTGEGRHRLTQQQSAAALQVCGPTVCAICRQYVLEGLDAALTEKPRPGQKPKITGEVEAHLVLLACSDPPEGHARWTMQLLADKLIDLKWTSRISCGLSRTICIRMRSRSCS